MARKHSAQVLEEGLLVLLDNFGGGRVINPDSYYVLRKPYGLRAVIGGKDVLKKGVGCFYNLVCMDLGRDTESLDGTAQ